MFDTEERGGAPVGTCFAISNQHLLSCQHFMKGRIMKYRIGSLADKNNGLTNITEGEREVKVIRWDSQMDFSILTLENEPYDLEPFPISLEDVEFDTDLKVFHYPVADFNENSSGIMSPFATWLKSSRSVTHKMRCAGPGLMKGSSGAPYVLRNGEVVAIHVEAISDAEAVVFSDGANHEAKFEALSKSSLSGSTSHGSLSYALLIRKCPGLVDFFAENGLA